MIFPAIKKIASGTKLPPNYEVKGIGKRRGEIALVYRIPNNSSPKGRLYEKGINQSEWEQAYQQLTKTGCFTREWFEKNMSECYAAGGCNFTVIGQVFVLLGHAEYVHGSGAYTLKRRSPNPNLVA